MLVSDFDYELPRELIAQEPCRLRDQSRLLVVHRTQSGLEHRAFYNLLDYVNPGDVLVLNETRVISARLPGKREDTGSRAEVFLLHAQESPLIWEVLVKPGRKAQPGMRLVFESPLNPKTDLNWSDWNNPQLRLEGLVLDVTRDGNRILEFNAPGVSSETLALRFSEVLDILGQTPLPPYITRLPEPNDRERYQTVYAREKGSVAAPTAGLHFTPQLLESLQKKGVVIVSLVLHVGLGTFRPVKVAEVTQHQMHSEYYYLSDQTADTINKARSEGGRVITVGTTATRVLETVADVNGRVWAGEGWTDIFIYPGYHFKVVDGLVTNFHLPRSTLLMLVCALAEKNLIFQAYREAVEQGYRFFSYGDAMLII